MPHSGTGETSAIGFAVLQTIGVAMRRLINRIHRFAASEDGPTAIEYAVMLSLILMLCIAAVRSFGIATNGMFTNISNSVGS